MRTLERVTQGDSNARMMAVEFRNGGGLHLADRSPAALGRAMAESRPLAIAVLGGPLSIQCGLSFFRHRQGIMGEWQLTPRTGT